MVDVGVVDRRAVLLEEDGRGLQFDHLKLPALGVGRGAEQVGDLPGRLVVGVGRVGLGVDGDHARAQEGRDDVDVAAGAEALVVAGEAARDPDRLGGAEVGVDLRLDLLLGPVGVAALAQLHGLGEQHGALAVDVDAAALVDQAGGEALRPGEVDHLLGDVLVVLPAGPLLCAPAVEHPVGRRQFALAVGEEGGADVAHPGVVQRALDDQYLGGEVALGVVLLAAVHHHGHRLEPDDGVGDGGPGLAGGVQLPLVEGLVAGGEGHPGAVVRLPLGGHREAELRRSLLLMMRHEGCSFGWFRVTGSRGG